MPTVSKRPSKSLNSSPIRTPQLLDAVTEKSSPAFALGMIELLANSKNLGPALVAKLPLLPPTARPVALDRFSADRNR